MIYKKILFIVLLLLGSNILFAESPVLIGRRGCGYAVENTAEAYKEAVVRGFRIVEAHVRLTADSIFVTSHDGKTDRLGGALKVPESTFEDLSKERYSQVRDFGSYDGSTICTVSEFLDICNKSGVTPLLHLKKLNKDSKDCAFLSKLTHLLDEKDISQHAILLTSEPDYIEYLLTNYPGLKLQFQADSKWEELFDWTNARNLDVQIRADLVDSECVKRYHDKGVKVNIWTVNTSDDLKRYSDMGVDYIVTDYLQP